MNEAVELQPIRIPAWVYAVFTLVLVLFFTLAFDNGQVLAKGAHWLHEFVHDGRHILGVPCH